VYVYASDRGLECDLCALSEWSFHAEDNAGMLAHLNDHIAAGHKVPDYCIDRLSDPRDAAENEAYYRENRSNRPL
jgi:hypothetical protein